MVRPESILDGALAARRFSPRVLDFADKPSEMSGFDSACPGVRIGDMIAMALPTDRKLISTSEAARILGVSMGRVRQLALLGSTDGGLDSWHAAPTALVFDEAQVKKLAKKAGTTGRPRGGFRQN